MSSHCERKEANIIKMLPSSASTAQNLQDRAPRRSKRLHKPHFRKVLPVDFRVQSKQPVRLHKGMSADQKIGENATRTLPS